MPRSRPSWIGTGWGGCVISARPIWTWCAAGPTRPPRLGYAIQLVTVRAIGTFLPDPIAVPAPVIAAVARQLEVSDPAVLVGYRVLPVRWRHTAEIRDRWGYRDFTAQPGHFLLLVWLYRQA